MTDTWNKKVSLRKRCIRIKLNIDSTIRRRSTAQAVAVLVGVGGRRRTRTTRKERKKNTVRHERHDKKTVQFVERTRQVLKIIKRGNKIPVGVGVRRRTRTRPIREERGKRIPFNTIKRRIDIVEQTGREAGSERVIQRIKFNKNKEHEHERDGKSERKE